MIPVTQFILGNSDPLLYPSEKMTNSIDEQIAFLHKVFESAITFWFKDVDFDGDKVWEYFHMNN